MEELVTICSGCNSLVIHKREGNTITIYHDCWQRRGTELINMIASSIADYPNAGGDKTIMEAIDKLVERVKNESSNK